MHLDCMGGRVPATVVSSSEGQWSTEEWGVRCIMCGVPSPFLLRGVCVWSTGSFDENYIHHFVQDAQLAGHRAVVFNYRGVGGAMLSVSGWGRQAMFDVSGRGNMYCRLHSTYVVTTMPFA